MHSNSPPPTPLELSDLLALLIRQLYLSTLTTNARAASTVTKDDSPEAQIPLDGKDEGFESF